MATGGFIEYFVSTQDVVVPVPDAVPRPGFNPLWSAPARGPRSPLGPLQCSIAWASLRLLGQPNS